MAKSKSLSDRFKSFADKISGISYVDNGNDPTSAAYKMKNAKPVKPFIPKPTSNGIGVGP